MAIAYSQHGVIVSGNGGGFTPVDEEPRFLSAFGDYVRSNFPSLPSGYQQVDGVRLSNNIFGLGFTPSTSDTDLCIYIAFDVVEVTQSYSSILATQYIDENRQIVRLITNGTSKNSFCINVFNNGSNSNTFSTSSSLKSRVMFGMRNSIADRYYFSNLNTSSSVLSAIFGSANDSEMSIGSPTIVLDIYELFIRHNGSMVHNWVPCTRESDSAYGFYNAVTGEFITNSSMSLARTRS